MVKERTAFRDRIRPKPTPTRPWSQFSARTSPPSWKAKESTWNFNLKLFLCCNRITRSLLLCVDCFVASVVLRWQYYSSFSSLNGSPLCPSVPKLTLSLGGCFAQSQPKEWASSIWALRLFGVYRCAMRIVLWTQSDDLWRPLFCLCWQFAIISRAVFAVSVWLLWNATPKWTSLRIPI